MVFWNGMNSFKAYPMLMGVMLLVSCSESTPEDLPVTVDAAELEQNNVVFTSDAGLSIGQKVPLHVKVLLNGKETDLAEVLETGPIILFFTRSVEWCGFCQAQLKGINKIQSDITERGYQIVALSYDQPEKQRKFIEAQKIGFKMLSDQSSELIDAFKLRDPQYTEGRAEGVPVATVVIIGKDGRIKSKTISGVHSIRPTNTEVLALIDSI